MNELKQKTLELIDRIDFDSIKFPSLALDSALFKLAVIVVTILVLSFAINFLLSRSVFGSRYRIFVAPGVILHELAHAFFCLITGAKIKKISLFDKDGGKVEHEHSKLPIFGQIIISFAPFIFGAIAIYFLAKLLGINQVSFNWELNSAPYSFWDSIKPGLGAIDVSRWQNWLILYLVLSVAVTMTPSRQDFENVAFSILFLLIAFLVVYQFISVNLSNIVIPERLVLLLTTTLFLLILSLVLSIVVYVLSFVVRHK